MAALMGAMYRFKEFGGDKMALLGLLVLALLTARLVVGLKSAVSLSEPVKLPCEELSVSMPSGHGWHSEEQWEFLENTFTVRSLFALRSGRPTAQARCRYLLAAEPASHEVRFERRASEIDGAVVKTGRIQTASLTIYWAHIERPDIFLDMFFGTATLPNDRQLDIELRQITGGADLAERTFKRIVTSLDFKENRLLEAGAEIVSELKARGLDSTVTDQGGQNFYWIKDSAGQPIGFTADGPIDSDTDTEWSIETAGLMYVRGPDAREEATVFQCGRNLDEFVYKTRTSSRTGRTITELVMDETGIMTASSSSGRPDEQRYYLGRATMPDVLLDRVLRQMLEAGRKEILVDLIEADGTITPTLVRQTEAGRDAAYVFELEFLDGRAFSEQVFLDEQGQIDGALLQQQDTYRIERTTSQSLAREFPEYSQGFLRSRRMSNGGL